LKTLPKLIGWDLKLIQLLVAKKKKTWNRYVVTEIETLQYEDGDGGGDGDGDGNGDVTFQLRTTAHALAVTLPLPAQGANVNE